VWAGAGIKGRKRRYEARQRPIRELHESFRLRKTYSTVFWWLFSDFRATGR